MSTIRDLRLKKGYSQREFARMASLSFRGMQLLEEEGHNWRVESMRKVMSAVHLPRAGIDVLLAHLLGQNSDSVMVASIQILSDGFASWPLHLFNFVDAFRSSRDEALVRAAPVDIAPRRIRALLASTTETLCDEMGIISPAWCAGIPALPEPWFVAGVESLKAMALIESPVQFRKRNAFVLENFLDRA